MSAWTAENVMGLLGNVGFPSVFPTINSSPSFSRQIWRYAAVMSVKVKVSEHLSDLTRMRFAVFNMCEEQNSALSSM